MRILTYAVCAGLLLTSAPAVLAQTVEQDGSQDGYSIATQRAQDLFVKYHMAMDADAACRQAKFSNDDLLAMDRAAAQEMVAESPTISLGAARLLNLRRKADDDFDTLYSREGCNGQKVKKLVAFYDERLANAHPMPDAPLPGDGKPAADTAQAAPMDAVQAQPLVDSPPAAAPESLVPAPDAAH